MEQWSRMYASYVQRRFSQASRGGSVDHPDGSRKTGAWTKLSPRTLAGRRKPKKRKGKKPKPPKVAILVDTSLLRKNLQPQIAKLGSTKGSNGVFKATATFGSTATYPKSSTTVREVMSYHQRGNKRLPQRIIFPSDIDQKFANRMGQAAKKIINKEIK
jgi:hypothetical protein